MASSDEQAEVHRATEHLDLAVHAALVRATGSVSLAAPLLAGMDWAPCLTISPGKCMDLASLAISQVERR